MVAVIELDPWGGETDRSVNQRPQPYLYTTYERDGDGVDQALMRSYHGWWTRFNEPDPWEGSYDLTDPQSFNRYTYVQNDPVNFTDPSGLCSAPKGLSSNSVGICIEAFIASATVGGRGYIFTGLGDNRGFSGTDSTLTNRAQVQLIVPRGVVYNGTAYQISVFAKAGKSQVKTPFGIWSRQGSIFVSVTNISVITNGGLRFTVGFTAQNGFRNFPGAPKGTIKANLTFEVDRDGKVKLMVPGSAHTAYPSFGVYSYNVVSGQIVTTTLHESQESGDIDDLQRPPPIEISHHDPFDVFRWLDLWVDAMRAGYREKVTVGVIFEAIAQ